VWLSKDRDTLVQDKLSYCSLGLGTGLHLVCQTYPAISSTPNPNVEDYKGRTVLSPPAAYPDRPWGRVANKGNFKLSHHVYTIDYYF
jgi:hypothetical protein